MRVNRDSVGLAGKPREGSGSGGAGLQPGPLPCVAQGLLQPCFPASLCKCDQHTVVQERCCSHFVPLPPSCRSGLQKPRTALEPPGFLSGKMGPSNGLCGPAVLLISSSPVPAAPSPGPVTGLSGYGLVGLLYNKNSKQNRNAEERNVPVLLAGPPPARPPI